VQTGARVQTAASIPAPSPPASPGPWRRPAVNDLAEWHQILHDHFTELRHRRDSVAPGTPLFALEHGLEPEAMDTLRNAVRAAVQAGPPSSTSYLPYVAHAAEVGYRFEGEYWQSFASTTPGWISNGNRNWIRSIFEQFTDSYGGARPSGAWGNHFTIISWPITHAVLPTDLQRHLVHLLSDYRHHLVPELIAAPDELGSRLAARAAATSARFRVFAKNVNLLGQVAAALLLGSSVESQLLEGSTLDRIVADLSVERESRRWLKEAQDAALRLRLRGLSRPRSPGGQSNAGGRGQARSEARVDIPKLSLQRSLSSWKLAIEPPDLSPLFDRFSGLQEDIAASRPIIAGTKTDPPLPRGRLLFLGLEIPVSYWPHESMPPIQLHDVDAVTNQLLAEACRSPFHDVCLFRVSADGTGTVIRGSQIRGGREYVMLTRVPIDNLPRWANKVEIQCENVSAYSLEVPDTLSRDDIEIALQLGLGVLGEVTLAPVGIEAAAWDGAGVAEWVLGDDPLLAISSTFQASHCVLLLDAEEPVHIPWIPDRVGTSYVQLCDLTLGTHQLQVGLIPSGGDQTSVSGRLDFLIREQRLDHPSGSFREALLLLSAPAAPTLEELWSGSANIDVLGAIGLQPEISVSLEQQAGHSIITKRLDVRRLPIDNASWRSAFERSFKKTSGVVRNYDVATSCFIEVKHPDVGTVSLRCDRSFVPLRWGSGEIDDEPFLRLHDNTAGEKTGIEYMSFDKPDVVQRVPRQEDDVYRNSAGGLFVARSLDEIASLILAPKVKTFFEFQQMGKISPQTTQRDRSAEGVVTWLRQVSLWAKADARDNPVVEKTRSDVIASFARSISSTLGGRDWEAAELAVEENGETSLPRILTLVVNNQPSVRLRDGLAELGDSFHPQTIEQRVLAFGHLMFPQFPDSSSNYKVSASDQRLRRSQIAHSGRFDTRWFAEFALRLASDPSGAIEWSGEDLQDAVAQLLSFPLTFKSARYLFLRLHYCSPGTDQLTLYEGWKWD
jgi:hypothetical protein